MNEQRILKPGTSIRDLMSLQLFVSVVETNSFARAAHRHNVAPSAVSKHVGTLEKKLGARLLNRTTRRLSVTEQGVSFYKHCLNIIRDLEIAEAALLEYNQEPKGMLRISAPNVLTTRLISPFVPDFLNRYPKISLDFTLTSTKVDMIQDGIDLSIRIAPSVGLQENYELLAPNYRVFCASPEYLDRHSTPQVPDDLSQHNCLFPNSVDINGHWPVREQGRLRNIRVNGNLISSNADLIRDALVGGSGIALISSFVVDDDLNSGRLVPILQKYTVQNSNFYAIFRHRRHQPLKTKVFIDLLKGILGSQPKWKIESVA